VQCSICRKGGEYKPGHIVSIWCGERLSAALSCIADVGQDVQWRIRKLEYPVQKALQKALPRSQRHPESNSTSFCLRHSPLCVCQRAPGHGATAAAPSPLVPCTSSIPRRPVQSRYSHLNQTARGYPAAGMAEVHPHLVFVARTDERTNQSRASQQCCLFDSTSASDAAHTCLKIGASVLFDLPQARGACRRCGRRSWRPRPRTPPPPVQGNKEQVVVIATL